jgi:UDP-N-acetyl-D-galactosamine dehydrogenase
MRDSQVACVGAGFVGLETALSFSEAGYDVVAVDTDPDLVAALKRGESPAGTGIDPERVSRAVDVGRLRASTGIDAAADADAYVVSVPTPVTDANDPDVSYLRAAAESIADVLAEGNLLVQQSTVYPGGCRDIIIPTIEEAGLSVGPDVGVAYVPERYSPGDDESKTAPRVVGAVSERWRDYTVELYEDIADTVTVSCIKVAECTKQIENVQRDVNIALINEAYKAFTAFDVDTAEVLEAAGTKWNFHRYDPGLGVGGHCIPVDPHYFVYAMREAGLDSSMIPAAREVNAGMPAYHAKRIESAVRARGDTLREMAVGVLGATYKPGIRDIRNSPALELAALLSDHGADVAVYDPLFKTGEPLGDRELRNGESVQEVARGADCVVVGTPHPEFEAVSLASLADAESDPLLVDPYRLFDPETVRLSRFRLCPNENKTRNPKVASYD